MTQITYLPGDATRPIKARPIIAHVCNNRGGWGAGFSGAISKRWKEPETYYRKSFKWRQLNTVLGSVQFVAVGERIIVANMIAQDGYSTPDKPAIDYAALAVCLADVADAARAHCYSVHMPRIGTGLAGGDWTVIEPMIVRELCERGVEVYVYDFSTGK